MARAQIRLRFQVGLPIVLAAAWLLGACGLFVTEDSHTLEPSPEASSRLDVAASSPDARVREAGLDAAVRDATLLDGSPVDGSASDATIADGGDSGTVGFCAALTPPDAAYVFCDDFDVDGDAGLVGTPIVSDASAVAVESMFARSAPSALLTTTNAGDADVARYSYLRHRLPVSNAYRIEFDMYVAELTAAPGNVTVTSGFEFQPASSSDLFIALNNVANDGGLQATVQEDDPADGGVTIHYHPSVPFSAGAWNHVSLAVNRTSTGVFVDTLAVNGMNLESNYALGKTFAIATPLARVGLNFVNEGSLRKVYFDNLVIVAE